MQNVRKCLICGHEWESRKVLPPKSCPKCKRYDWNKIKPPKKLSAEQIAEIEAEVVKPDGPIYTDNIDIA